MGLRGPQRIVLRSVAFSRDNTAHFRNAVPDKYVVEYATVAATETTVDRQVAVCSYVCLCVYVSVCGVCICVWCVYVCVVCVYVCDVYMCVVRVCVCAVLVQRG